MSPENWVYALGGAGVALAILRTLMMTVLLKLDAPLFTDMVVKLIKAGNLDRALKLCQAGASKYYPAGLLPALECSRHGKPRSRELIEAFEGGVATKSTVLALGSVMGLVAGVLALVGLGYGLLHAEAIPPTAFAAPALGLLLTVTGAAQASRLGREGKLQFERVLEALGYGSH